MGPAELRPRLLFDHKHLLAGLLLGEGSCAQLYCSVCGSISSFFPSLFPGPYYHCARSPDYTDVHSMTSLPLTIKVTDEPP